MKAVVRESPVKKPGQPQLYRVCDDDHPEKEPILNRSGDPIDGGGHKKKGISEMLANEVNEKLEKRNK